MQQANVVENTVMNFVKVGPKVENTVNVGSVGSFGNVGSFDPIDDFELEDGDKKYDRRIWKI